MELQQHNKATDILAIMQTITRRTTLQETPGPDLPGYFSQQLNRSSTRFEAAYHSGLNQRAALKLARTEFRTQEAVLRQMLRDAFVNIRTSAKRLESPENLHIAFGLKAKGSYPNDLKYLKNPIEIAEAFLNTHAQLITPEEPILRLPSAEELQAQVDRTMASKTTFEAEENKAKLLLSELRLAKDEAQGVLISIKGHLRAVLRRLDKVQRREIMRSYGFSYRGDTAPEPEPDQADAANTGDAQPDQGGALAETA